MYQKRKQIKGDINKNGERWKEKMYEREDNE